MTEAADTLRPGVPLTGLLDVVKGAMFVEFREELEKTGYADIRPTHGCVFRFIQGEGMRLTELAGLAGITKQSAGEMVDDLVRLGYVERIPDPADRRAKLICLTDRGKEAQQVGFALFAEIESRWTERYGADSVAQLRHLLEEIAAAEAPQAVPELARRQLATA